MNDCRTDAEFMADQAEKIRSLAAQLKDAHLRIDARGIAMLDQTNIGRRIEALFALLATAERERDEFKAGMEACRLETARVMAKLERAHAYIRHQPYEKDFGCYDCDPVGDSVVAGFVCAFHEAQS